MAGKPKVAPKPEPTWLKPALMAFAAEAIPQQPTEREYHIITACATAFLAFFARHRALFNVDEPGTVCVSFTGHDDVTVTISAPYESEALDDASEEFFDDGGLLDFEESASLENVPARRELGRNDPCPCGSGKKYKKCHLDAGRTSGERAPDESVHEMDFRLVKAIGRFASDNFGEGWPGGAADGLRG